MKTINDYLSLPYRLEILPDREEGGYTAWYPDLPGCVTCGETLERVAANAEDAKRAWLEAALREGLEIAEPSDGQDRRMKYPAQDRRRYENRQIQV
ncbi:MAG: type II toxin-antitoxin system HicB family antitoxin [Oscillibacter sp.]|nr:type II toxin-antitoxin system HicB family antitoxin [Oscillibacter sp.]